jgi:hypothetical protein
MLPPLPRCSSWTYSSLVSPSRISLPRKGCRVGLHIVLFEVCSAFTRVAACTLARPPIRGPLYRRLQPFRHLHDCSGCFRLERVAGWAFHPLERAAFHGAHPGRSLSGYSAIPDSRRSPRGFSDGIAHNVTVQPTIVVPPKQTFRGWPNRLRRVVNGPFCTAWNLNRGAQSN